MPGRIYAIGCKCGHTIVVKGPGMSGGVRNGVTAPVRDDPFAAFHERLPHLPLPVAQPPRAMVARRAEVRPALPPPSAPPEPAGTPWPQPAEPESPSFEPVAAGPGAVLDIDHARALSSGSMSPEASLLPPTPDDEEVSVTFSEKLPLPPRERHLWLLGAAVGLACMVAVGGLVAFRSRQPSPTGEPDVGTAPSTPTRAQPAAVALPPSAPTTPSLPALVKTAPAPEASFRKFSPASATRAPSGPRPARPARRTPGEPAVAEKATRPASSALGSDPAAAPALLDLLSRKADVPTAPPTPESLDGTPATHEVEAAVERNRSAFDACFEQSGRTARRPVVLSVTVHPSGIVTSPRLDDSELEESATGACLKAAARKLVVPSFSGDRVRVRVPLAAP